MRLMDLVLVPSKPVFGHNILSLVWQVCKLTLRLKVNSTLLGHLYNRTWVRYCALEMAGTKVHSFVDKFSCINSSTLTLRYNKVGKSKGIY